MSGPQDRKNLDSWLIWLESLHPKKIDLTLERVSEVASRLCLLPHTSEFRSRYPGYEPTLIIVAGTNGKGSCVETLSTLADALSISHGCYTSPHILRYNERIKIDRNEVGDAAIIEAFEAIDCARSQDPALSLSYFEFATLAALYCFAQSQARLWVLEVGLGGRLDATNIVDANLAIITSIALDHEHFLGTTIESIAREKAGVMRVGQQVVLAETAPCMTLTDHARSLMVDLAMQPSEFELDSNRKVLRINDQEYAFAPSLPEESAAAAVVAFLKVFPEFNERQEELVHIAQRASLWGRFTRLEFNQAFDALKPVVTTLSTGLSPGKTYRNTLLILDVAHNPAACRRLAGQLRDYLGSARVKVVALFGMMADKDRLASLESLIELIDEWRPVTLESTPRRADYDLLKSDLAELGVSLSKGARSMADNIAELLDDAKAVDDHTRVILVFGSFFSVYEASTALINHQVLDRSLCF